MGCAALSIAPNGSGAAADQGGQRTLTVLAQERCCAGKLLGRKKNRRILLPLGSGFVGRQYAIMAELLPQSGETSKHFHIVLRETVLQSGSHDLFLISNQELKSHIALGKLVYISID